VRPAACNATTLLRLTGAPIHQDDDGLDVSPRLPLRELEEASADPTGYRAKLYGPPRQAQGSIYFNALRNAIFNFHKPQWTAAQAERVI
jgi:hypothetical protein